MANNQAHVLYVPGCDITCDAKAAVKGGTFVAPSGDIAVTHPVVSTATADTTPLGVAAYDAEKDTQVLVIRGNAVVEVTAGGVFAAGDAISVGANGKAVDGIRPHCRCGTQRWQSRFSGISRIALRRLSHDFPRHCKD